MKYLYSLAVLSYILTSIFTNENLHTVVSMICLLIVLLTFFYVSRFVQMMGIIFLGLGFGMLYKSDSSWVSYLDSFGPMLNLLTLFAIVPILAIPIKLGNYADGIQNVIKKKVKHSGQLYMVTSGVSYFFSCFMNLATLPMTYYSIQPSVKLFSIFSKERFMSRAVTHGFAMPLLWTPVTPIVGIIIEMTGVNWGEMLQFLIPLSIAGLLLDWFMGVWISSKRHNHNNALLTDEIAVSLDHEVEEAVEEKKGRLIYILIAILLFNAVISILEYWSKASFLFLVSILVIPFASIWSISLRKTKQFKQALQEHFQTHLMKMKEQFFIFLSAGFFISAIDVSNTDKLIHSWIISLKGVIGTEGFLFILPLIPLVLAFTGIHPAVAVALMAGALDPVVLGISPKLLTVAMLGGAVSAFLMGPYNATIGLMSTIINESPFRISNWNSAFTVSYLALLAVYLYFLQVVVF